MPTFFCSSSAPNFPLVTNDRTNPPFSHFLSFSHFLHSHFFLHLSLSPIQITTHRGKVCWYFHQNCPIFPKCEVSVGKGSLKMWRYFGERKNQMYFILKLWRLFWTVWVFVHDSINNEKTDSRYWLMYISALQIGFTGRKYPCELYGRPVIERKYWTILLRTSF